MMSAAAITIYFEADPALVAPMQAGPSSSRATRQVRFGGHEATPVNGPKKQALSQGPSSRIFSVTVQGEQGLLEANKAFKLHGIPAWVMISTAQGLAQVELSAFVQQQGLG